MEEVEYPKAQRQGGRKELDVFEERGKSAAWPERSGQRGDVVGELKEVQEVGSGLVICGLDTWL